jgi:hypothetical protein
MATFSLPINPTIEYKSFFSQRTRAVRQQLSLHRVNDNHPRLLRLFLAVSFHRPRFCLNASWTISGTTLLTQTNSGNQPTALFIDGVHSLFVSSPSRNTIYIQAQGFGTIHDPISGSFNQSLSHFVLVNGDVFVDNGFHHRRVNRCVFNESRFVVAMNVNGSCHGLFVDLNETLYCSMGHFHQVHKRFAHSLPNQTVLAAGTGQAGFSSNMLNTSRGIDVDENNNLYVADCGNNPIQCFAANQLTATTLVGNGSAHTIHLRCPTSIALDADAYLFFVDSLNHRIVGSSPMGYRWPMHHRLFKHQWLYSITILLSSTVRFQQ